MIPYKDYEKSVFDWLIQKQQNDPTFTFSIRRKGSKGAELDYFIGTSASNYFATTFWYIPIGFPGSSTDLFDVFFTYTKDNKLSYYFELVQTRSPIGMQNTLALEFVKQLKTIFKTQFSYYIESPATNKMEWCQFSGRNENGYEKLENLFSDLEKDLEIVMPIVDKLLEDFKAINTDFIGHRISAKEFADFLDKKNRRFERFANGGSVDDENEEETATVGTGNQLQKLPLNQILFGPPGTGKTYNSIKKAVEIATPQFAAAQWKDIKEEFDRLVESGQVVFTTFHQSMSYEDFIEGIKPVTDDENGTVTYEVQKGIFKLISEDAQKNHQLSNEKTSKFVKTDFDTLWGILIEQISTTLESGKVFELPTLTNKAFEVVSISDKGNLKVRPLDNGQREYIVSYRRTKKLFEAFPSLSEISNIDREFRNIIGGANSTSYWSVLNYLQKNINIKPTITNEEPKNFVIVIDEINRGNISQVFGELITLIEEDKREGKSEALKITLPYSKEKFSVPSNLYIIGTMNTADRSVEALDTALRRRFSFEEMPPKYDLEELNYTVTENIKATDILAKINLRLEKLLDKDHLIGHSFFICKEGETPLEKVKETFYKNIIPLLQEYFYGDYGKIGLVLGKGFIRKKESSQQSFFAEFEGYESNFNERDIFEIIDYRNTNEADTFENALKILMGK